MLMCQISIILCMHAMQSIKIWFGVPPTQRRLYTEDKPTFGHSTCKRKRSTFTDAAVHYKAISDRLALDLDLDLDTLPEAMDLHSNTVCGILDLTPDMPYSYMMSRSAAQAAQIRYYHQAGIDIQNLWFFSIRDSALLPSPVSLSVGIALKQTHFDEFKLLSKLGVDRLLQDIIPHPEWLPDNIATQTKTLLLLPCSIALAVTEGLGSIAIPDIYARAKLPPNWIRIDFDTGLRGYFNNRLPTEHPDGASSALTFQADQLAKFADYLREVHATFDHSNNSRFELQAWIQSVELASINLVPLHRQSGPHGIIGFTRDKDFGSLTSFLLLATHLKDTSDLRDVIQKCCEMLLPTDLLELAMDILHSTYVPKAPEVSRARFFLDVAWMLHHRVRNMLPRPAFSRSLAWDSSPQGGRDYELAIMRSILKSDLRGIFQNMHRLFHMWDDAPWNSLDEVKRRRYLEQDIMADIKSRINMHAFSACLIGFGAAGFAQRLQCLVHEMRLDHFSNRSLALLWSELCTSVNDYGTEKALTTIKPTRISHLIPYFSDTSAADIKLVMASLGVDPLPSADPALGRPRIAEVAQPEAVGIGNIFDADIFEAVPAGDEADVFEDVPVQPPMEENLFDEESEISVDHLLEVPPIHHINDTAAKSLKQAMPSFDNIVHGAQQVCSIIRKRKHKTRLLERCFNSIVALHYHPQLKSFRGHIHVERWATWAFSIPELKKLSG
jgi:hypothetical protein